jgi:hypothetical protein
MAANEAKTPRACTQTIKKLHCKYGQNGNNPPTPTWTTVHSRSKSWPTTHTRARELSTHLRAPPPSILVEDHSMVVAAEEVPFEEASPMDTEEAGPEDGSKYLLRP